MIDSPSPQKNRRIAARRAFRGKIKVMCYKGRLDLGTSVAVKLLDISESGMRLVVNISLDKSQEVLVLLESLRHARPVKMPGTVVWCVPSDGQTFLAGLRFDKYLEYADFTHFT